ncbi:MAG: sodium-dependent bicarbonate transport family permease [Kiritimatiellae bacterium]|nr:sodium-dependent bicarbonate transport family permease [Kiritimatiellia bacterium]MDW8459232.1 sodium-dependent bicarbonate transport family permease [Verrucomicrobiota bacterium]
MTEAHALLLQNLLSPLVLAFAVGMLATLIRSELEFPPPVLNAISIYLVLSIALQGGVELASQPWSALWKPMLGAAAVALAIPTWSFWAARRILRLSTPNAAGLAALYGSVSSVTFLAALNFAAQQGHPAEPYMPVFVTIMEWGILTALFCARMALKRERAGRSVPIREILIDTLRGRSVILLLGGLVIGAVIGEKGFAPIKPVFKDGFYGVLVLFLLEMGMVAARQLREFVQLGPKLLAWGIAAPTLHGLAGVALGHALGLSAGGAFVFGAITASASYIDAPAAVRAALPEANPGIYLTCSLGITFPFNLLIGLPMYYSFAQWLTGC